MLEDHSIRFHATDASRTIVPDPERILLIRPSALGDVCRSVPVLASLRRAHPDAAIDWLVRDDFRDAVAAHPDLTDVVPFSRRALGRSMARANPVPTLRWLGALRRRRYDLVVDAQGLARSGLFARATGAPRRVGFANARELAWLAYTERHHADRSLHTVDRMLRLVEAMGVEPVRDMRLHAPAAGRARVESEPRLAGGRHVVLAPTSIWPAKRWPDDRFARLAASLLDAGAEAVAVVGAPGERDQCRPLLDLAARDERVVDLVGQTSIGELMAVIERSRLVVANDSAALHIAVGFDRPIVALFGPTRTHLVGPYGRGRDVLQHLAPDERIDHKRDDTSIIERITIDEVLDAATARLAASTRSAGEPAQVSRSSPRSPS